MGISFPTYQSVMDSRNQSVWYLSVVVFLSLLSLSQTAPRCHSGIMGCKFGRTEIVSPGVKREEVTKFEEEGMSPADVDRWWTILRETKARDADLFSNADDEPKIYRSSLMKRFQNNKIV